MYKFTNHLTNSKLVLVQRHLGDGRCAALVVMRTPKRCKSSIDSTECKAPPPKPKGKKLFYGMMGATLITGAAVVYAKHSPEARNFLESNIPWANDFVALVYQENTTWFKAAVNVFNKYTTYLSHFMFGKEGITPMDITPRSEQDLEKDAEKVFNKRDYVLPPPMIEPLYVEEKKIGEPQVEAKATIIKTEKCEPQTPVTVKVTKECVDLEQEMHENTKIAIDNYKIATAASAEYNKALFKIIEASIDELDKKNFVALQAPQGRMTNALRNAKEASAKAKCAIETLDRMIHAGAIQAPPENVAMTKRYIKQFRADLCEAEDNYKRELEMSVLSEKYWHKVNAARQMFKEELESMFPGIDLNARRLECKGDTDLLLVYVLKKVQYLQNEIAQLQTVRDLKLSRAIECKDEKAIIEAKAEDIVRRERMAREDEFMKKALLIQAEANKNTKEQLKKQYEIQQEILQDNLARKEKEIMANFNRIVSEQVEAERVLFKKELAAMAGKLQAIEQTLKQRAAAESEARRSQSLWAAAEALLAATRKSADTTKVDNELNALEKAAGKEDKLVETVLKGIPDDVREKGIATERALRDRFEKMEQTAIKVALVGREGATLPIYFLSWLQSKLMFQKLADIPKDELENKPTDFTKLDTFDIMQRARYYMEHGNLPAALRYVNLLQGASRAAARPWAEAARRHLEIKQAAEAVMAHASVSGLLYL